jgi:hypothetical protein
MKITTSPADFERSAGWRPWPKFGVGESERSQRLKTWPLKAKELGRAPASRGFAFGYSER